MLLKWYYFFLFASYSFKPVGVIFTMKYSYIYRDML